MKVVIVGGGICGLACAVALGRAGIEVDVIERNDQFTEIGAGIQLAANSFRALDMLGVAERVIAAAVAVRHLSVLDGFTGDPLATMTTGTQYQTEFGYPYMVVHRRDIHRALFEAASALPEVRLISGVVVTGFTETDETVTVHTFPGGNQFVGHILIGADGIRSTIRMQLFDDGLPKMCGHTIYRSVVDLTDVPECIQKDYTDHFRCGIPLTLWAGTDWHLVNYPIAEGRQLNLAITHVDKNMQRIAGEPVDQKIVTAIPKFANPKVVALLTSGHNWRKWTLADRPVSRHWASGRAVLVGDAAHPMLQYAAQGAGMAIEDAVVFSQTMTTGTDSVQEKLQRFTEMRSARVGMVRDLAVELGQQVYHTTVRTRDIRNQWLSRYTDNHIRHMVRWLHGSINFTDIPSPGLLDSDTTIMTNQLEVF